MDRRHRSRDIFGCLHRHCLYRDALLVGREALRIITMHVSQMVGFVYLGSAWCLESKDRPVRCLRPCLPCTNMSHVYTHTTNFVSTLFLQLRMIAGHEVRKQSELRTERWSMNSGDQRACLQCNQPAAPRHHRTSKHYLLFDW